jgi:hypothetical protein
MVSNCEIGKFHEGMAHRLSVIGVPHHIISGLPDLIIRWVRCSGVEWTISRLKSLKVDLIRIHSGQPALSTFRKNRRGEIAGLFGSLVRFSQKSEKCFAKAIQCSMIYSVFKFESLTQKQEQKFRTAIMADPPWISRNFLISLGRAIKQNFRKISLDRSQEISLLTYRGSPSKFKPKLYWDDYRLRSIPQLSRKQDSDELSNAKYFCDPKHLPL